MVKIGLQFKAFLEHVTGLMPEGEDFRFVFNSIRIDRRRCKKKLENSFYSHNLCVAGGI